MATQRLNAWCGEVRDFLELNDKMTVEAGEVLQGLSSKLKEFSRETANIRSRATTLTTASINIRVMQLYSPAGLLLSFACFQLLLLLLVPREQFMTM